MSTSILVLSLLVLPSVPTGLRPGGPTYADSRAKRAVERMVDAHGGLETWRALASLSYEHEMLDPSQPADPWISHEVHEPRTRHTYHEWPRDGARLGFDGERVWTVGWKRMNPPSMMSGVSFFFLTLPFITQDDGAHIEYVGKKEVEHVLEGKPVIALRLTFEGASEHEYYELYQDPRSHLLVVGVSRRCVPAGRAGGR